MDIWLDTFPIGLSTPLTAFAGGAITAGIGMTLPLWMLIPLAIGVALQHGRVLVDLPRLAQPQSSEDPHHYRVQAANPASVRRSLS